MPMLSEIQEAISPLDDDKLELICGIAKQFSQKSDIHLLESSDLFNADRARIFMNFLMIHHALSTEPFTKEKFEYAMVSTFRKAGFKASKVSNRTNRGHDISIEKERFSCKTQADSKLKVDKLHISKFMELGKGDWDYEVLRELFLNHMNRYDRILSLRCLYNSETKVKYELVEIPKILLQEARNGVLEASRRSKQKDKIGTCKVTDKDKKCLKFQLYFDGGTERKLQIKHLMKSYCIVHATWEFDILPIFPEEKSGVQLLTLI